MNQQEFSNLQGDIKQIFNNVKMQHPATKELLDKNERELIEKYFVKKQNVKKAKKDRHEEVKKLLLSRLKEPQEHVTVNDEDNMVDKKNSLKEKKENVKNLIKAINYSKTMGIRYNFLLGNILKQIQDGGRKKFYDFVEDISYNADYCRFLVKFYKLLNMYNKLQNINLPIRYFKTNYTIIKDICQDNQAEWKN